MKRSEWISQKLGGLPEWVQIIIALAIMIFIAYLVAYQVHLSGGYETPTSVDARPSIFIIQAFAFESMDGQKSYVLDYAKDGEVQAQAVFSSSGQLSAFRHYLDEKYGIVNKK